MMRRLPFAVLLAAVLLLAPARARAQAPAAPPTTHVLVSLTLKPGADRARIMKTMPDEVRATVALYLDGKIQEWYSRGDGRGVIFIMPSSSVADAKALMDTLPLAKADLAVFEFTPLGPLTPLRLLLAPAAAPAPGNPQP